MIPVREQRKVVGAEEEVAILDLEGLLEMFLIKARKWTLYLCTG